MPKIFISYRRADSQYAADPIYAYFRNEFGAENVFLDVGSILFGVDFRDYLRDQIAQHDVVLVIIGPQWERIMRERADEANDFVRFEITSALKLNKLIIPVTVMDAPFPEFSDLPESVRELNDRLGAEIRAARDFRNDCTHIAERIEQHTTPTPEPKPVEDKNVQALAWLGRLPNVNWRLIIPGVLVVVWLPLSLQLFSLLHRIIPPPAVTANIQWVPISQYIKGIEMALVPPGCFMMGSEDGDDNEQPVNQVCFDEPFWID